MFTVYFIKPPYPTYNNFEKLSLLYKSIIIAEFKTFKESAVVEWLASGISKPGVPGLIPSRGTTVMVECPWARHIF